MDWWLKVRTADGDIHLYPLGDPDDTERADLIWRAKAHHGVPADWEIDPGVIHDWDVAISPGEPHPTLLAASVVHSVDELATVDTAVLDARTAAVAELDKQARLRRAQEALADLDTDDMAELLRRYGG